MSAHQAVFPVAVMARVLGVSEAGFHAWRRRPASAQAPSADRTRTPTSPGSASPTKPGVGKLRRRAQLAGAQRGGRASDAAEVAFDRIEAFG